MDIQCERFLNGEIIYAPIPTHWNIYPPHFPAYWLPFVPFKYFNLDIRWASIILLIASFWLVLLSLLKLQRNNLIAAILIFISAFLYFNYLIQKNTGFITITHEGIALFYYALLGYALLHKKPILIGIAMALCLLSRFYIILFVPLYFLYSYFFADKKQTKIEFISFMAVMIICGLPFFIQTPQYFFYIPTQYKILDANLWKVDFKTILNGYGLAKYFLQNQYELVNKMNEIFPIAIPIIFFAIAYFKKLFNKIEPNLIALSGIKLLMCFFYAIVQAPYSYLFLVPAIFSYFVVFSYFETTRNNFINKV
jgi:hypothetical protein